MPSYVIGVDGGTESLRAAVFDSNGTILGSSACPYETQFPQPAWAEQRPEDWWQALGVAVSGAVTAAGVASSDVKAICLDTTCCTVVALDADGLPLRPALLWMDMRSTTQAKQVASCGDPALRVNSAGNGPVSAEWMIPKSLWIKQNEPEIWERAHTICEYQDFLNLRLTGRMVASVNNASVRWHYSAASGWPLSMLAKLGLSDLLSKWPQELLPLGDPVGNLTPEAARHLGLEPGTLVAQGGADAFIGVLGLGVVRPGQMALLTGSSHLQLGFVATETHGQGFFGTYTSAVLPGLHVIEGGQTSTGSIVNWFKKNLVAPGVDYDTLNAEAEQVPPGCEGLVCLDHFQGNRTPHTDPLSRGALVGLTLKHGRAHVFRSLMESVAFGTRLILDTMGKHGCSPDTIVIAGGSARSPLWLQIHADICNRPFVLTQCCEAPMLGCAALAAAAVGLHPSITEAVMAMVKVDRVIEPNAKVHEEYNRHFERYAKLYPALKDIFHGPPGAAAAQDQTAALLTQPELHNGSHRVLRGILSASILAADFTNLGAEVEAALHAGAQWIHVDMFDQSYVANFTIGPPVLKALRARFPEAFLDCHLAVQDPAKYIPYMAAAGASLVTFHAEVLDNDAARMQHVAQAIRAAGMRVGVALAPETPAAVVAPLVQSGAVDMVLCMTVMPGFGGQKMMPSVLTKVQQLRQLYPALDIQVDGGVNGETAASAVEAGANVLVAGSAVFQAIKPGAVRDVERMKACVSAIHEPLLKAGLMSK